MESSPSYTNLSPCKNKIHKNSSGRKYKRIYEAIHMVGLPKFVLISIHTIPLNSLFAETFNLLYKVLNINEKCSLDQCYCDSLNLLWIFPGTYLYSLIKIRLVTAEILRPKCLCDGGGGCGWWCVNLF